MPFDFAGEVRESTGWELCSTHTSADWKSVDSSSDAIDALAQSCELPTLSAAETQAVLRISANRVRSFKKPDNNGKYRREDLKGALGAALPGIPFNCQNVVLGIALLAAAVAFSNVSPGSRIQTVAHSSRTVKLTHHKLAFHWRSAKSPIAASASHVSGSERQQPRNSNPAPVLEAQIPEYRGPSSVTGLPVQHRHAYQTALLGMYANHEEHS